MPRAELHVQPVTHQLPRNSRAGRKQMFAALMSQAPRFLHFHFKRVADIPLGEKVEFVCRWAGKHVDKYRRESHVQR